MLGWMSLTGCGEDLNVGGDWILNFEDVVEEFD